MTTQTPATTTDARTRRDPETPELEAALAAAWAERHPAPEVKP